MTHLELNLWGGHWCTQAHKTYLLGYSGVPNKIYCLHKKTLQWYRVWQIRSRVKFDYPGLVRFFLPASQTVILGSMDRTGDLYLLQKTLYLQNWTSWKIIEYRKSVKLVSWGWWHYLINFTLFTNWYTKKIKRNHGVEWALIHKRVWWIMLGHFTRFPNRPCSARAASKHHCCFVTNIIQ